MKKLNLLLVVGFSIFFVENRYLRANLFGDLLGAGKEALEKKEKEKRSAKENFGLILGEKVKFERYGYDNTYYAYKITGVTPEAEYFFNRSFFTSGSYKIFIKEGYKKKRIIEEVDKITKIINEKDYPYSNYITNLFIGSDLTKSSLKKMRKQSSGFNYPISLKVCDREDYGYGGWIIKLDKSKNSYTFKGGSGLDLIYKPKENKEKILKLIKEKEERLAKEKKEKEEKLAKAYQFFSNNYITYDEYNKKVGFFLSNISKNSKAIKQGLANLESQISNRIKGYENFYLVQGLVNYYDDYTNKSYQNFFKQEMGEREFTEQQKKLKTKLINKKWAKKLRSKTELQEFGIYKKAKKNLTSYLKKNKIVVELKIEDITSKKVNVYKGGKKKYLQKVDRFIKRNKNNIKKYVLLDLKNHGDKYGKKISAKSTKTMSEEIIKKLNSFIKSVLLHDENDDYSKYSFGEFSLLAPYTRYYDFTEENKKYYGYNPRKIFKAYSKSLKLNFKKNEFKKSDITQKEIYYLKNKMRKGDFEKNNYNNEDDYHEYRFNDLDNEIEKKFKKEIMVLAKGSHYDNNNFFYPDILLANEENSLNCQKGKTVKIKVNYFDFIAGEDLQEKDIVK